MTNDSSQHYCLRWNNHVPNLVEVLAQLLQSETFVDCTIAIDDGTTIKCHKMVLAACSTYFNDLFTKNPCEHSMVILSDVKHHEIRAILDYMYRGEVNVPQEDLPGLIKIAYILKVKGLIDDGLSSGMRMLNLDREEPSLNILSAAAAAANGSGYSSPPSHAVTPFSVPYGPMPVWPGIAGLHLMPQHPISGHQPPPRSAFPAGSYDAVKDNSPLGLKKRSSYMAHPDTPILRNVLGGHGDAPPNNGHEMYGSGSTGSLKDADRRNSSERSEPMPEDDQKPSTSHRYGSQRHGSDRHGSDRHGSDRHGSDRHGSDRHGSDKHGSDKHGSHKHGSHKHGYHKVAKPEWKRYKQYSRQDILAAMEVVRRKEMSALQAASKFRIPSRTLYDKLKKAGIMPGRGLHRASRSSCASTSSATLCADSARFPYPSDVSGTVYGAAAGKEVSENEIKANGSEGPCSLLLVDPPNGDASRNDDMGVLAGSSNEQQSGNEEGAEDLSVGSRRSSGHSVVAPPAVKKEEEDEPSTQQDEP